MNGELEEQKQEDGSVKEEIKKTSGWLSILISVGAIFSTPIVGFLGGLFHINLKLFQRGVTSGQKAFILFVDGVAVGGAVLAIAILLVLLCEIPGSGLFFGGSCNILDLKESPFASFAPPSSTGRGALSGGEIAGDKCEPCEVGFATPDHLETTIASSSLLQSNCGPSFDPVVASRVANAESTCNSYRSSSAKCLSDGTEFAIGLFQINMTVHEIYDAKGNPVTMQDSKGNVYHCKDVFSGTDLDCRKKTGELYDELYKKCYETLRINQDAPYANLLNACKIQKTQGWDAWVAYSDYADCRDKTI